MCANCDEARGPIADEIVRRIGATRETVMDVLKCLEEMTLEADTIREAREEAAKDAIAAALSGDREQAIEGLRTLFGEGVEMHVIEVGADGTPAPAPAHPIDRPTGPDVGETRTGMYL